MSKQSNIKYYVNEEKGTCVAVLRNVCEDIFRSMHTKLGRCGISDTTWLTKDLSNKYMQNVPDTLTARATCSPNDTFNKEIGCAIARARLLAKLYRLRAKSASIIAESLCEASEAFKTHEVYYNLRSNNYQTEATAGTLADELDFYARGFKTTLGYSCQ